MNSSVVRFWRWISISSWVTAAWTETSRAETGSSAITTLGVAGEGAGDADALLLAAGELARPAVVEGARQLDQVQQLEHPLADALGILLAAELVAPRARSGRRPSGWD